MSWEDISVDDHVCPCGGGSYSITTSGDDWGRYRSFWNMGCARCARQYALYPGNAEELQGWVRKSQLQQWKRLERQAGAATQAIEKHMKTRYGARWREHFMGKTKKAIWLELHRGARPQRSLSAF